jgi:phosphotransferase system HPr (HPr) family protein
MTTPTRRKHERTVTVRLPLGLHLRPGTEFCKQAGRFRSEILVDYQGAVADGKSILDVLGLAIERGNKCRIVAAGDDAEEAVQVLSALLEATEE